MRAVAEAQEAEKRTALTAAGVFAASTLLNTLTEPSCEFRLTDQNKLVVVSKATGPKKIKKHTSLAQWSDGTMVTSKPGSYKFWPLELSSQSLVYCKEGQGIMTLAKAYTTHWNAYDHITGFQKFTKGNLPKILVPEDADKRRYLVVNEPEKANISPELFANVIEAARDSSKLQAAVSI